MRADAVTRLGRFDLDPVVRQREEAIVPVREVEAGRTLSEVVVERVVDLLRCEAVDDGLELLDVGQAAWEFSEIAFCGVDVEQVVPVRAFLDLGDLAFPAGKRDVVADVEVSHPGLLLRRFLSLRR